MKSCIVSLRLFLIVLILYPWFSTSGVVQAAGAAGDTTETLLSLGSTIGVSGYNVAGVTVAGSIATITAGGAYRATGALSDGMIEVNTTEEATLMLDGASITHSSGPAINGTNAAKLTIVLASGTTNTLSDGSGSTLKATLFSNDPLEITGDGTLNVTGIYKHAVASDDNLTISGGMINVLSATKDGFHANDDIAISGGAITVAQAGSDGLESEGTLEITGGTLALSVTGGGIKSVNTLKIDDGAITIAAPTVEGIESEADLIINGGAFTIEVGDDGLNAATNITINDGELFLDGSGDGVDTNGTLHINGGVIVARGGSARSGMACADADGFVITGGTLVAMGDGNSVPSSRSTQYAAVLGGQKAGSILHTELGGADVLTFQASQDYASMVFTSPSLQAGATHTLTTGGTVSGGTHFHGLYTGAGYSGGTVRATFTTNSVVTYVR